MKIWRRAFFAFERPTEPLLRRAAPKAYDALRAWRLGGSFPEYFDRTQSIFIHVPKAAGTSVAMALYGRSFGHDPWRHWHQLNPRKFETYFKFAVVRDPLTRFVSAFLYLKRGGMNEDDRTFASTQLAPYDNPAQLALALVNPEVQKSILKWRHFRPQHEFVADEHGRCKVDALMSFETLPQSFEDIRRRINPRCTLPHLNRGDGSHLKLLDGQAIEILKCIYERDWRLLSSAASASHNQ